jgi:hypothetical protein
MATAWRGVLTRNLCAQAPRSLPAPIAPTCSPAAQLRCEWREREAASPAAGLWPAGDSRPRSRRGPGVQPFTPDPAGPSEPTRLVTGWPLPTDGPAEGPAGSGRAAGWTLGGDSAQCSPPSPGRNHGTTITPCRAPAARRARGAERERTHSRSKRRRVRAVSARLETVQKVLTDQDRKNDRSDYCVSG